MNTKRLKELAERNDQIDVNDDDAQDDIWEEMCKILSENLEETIKYLDNASSLEIYYVSAIYDDVNEHFQSEEFIKCIERNAIRTGVDCEVDIRRAREVMQHN